MDVEKNGCIFRVMIAEELTVNNYFFEALSGEFKLRTDSERLELTVGQLLVATLQDVNLEYQYDGN